MLSQARGIDIFGDLHGQAAALHAGLETLGYEQLSGVWRHPGARKALFLGDLIDRGSNSRQVVNTVRMMVEHGEAVCIMGNHELNAVHFAQPHPEAEGYLRPRTDKNLFQHVAFLHEYRGKEEREALATDLAFFRSLPLMVELDGMRAIHACWNDHYLREFSTSEISGSERREHFWLHTSSRGHRQHSAVEVLLKGPEKELPNGRVFYDKDGHERRHARIRWWSDSQRPEDRVIGPPSLAEAASGMEEFDTSEFAYSSDEPPIFFGHYWLRNDSGIPQLTRAPNVQCLDFSVGAGNGQLGIYRWNGEEKLHDANLLAVSAAGDQIVQRTEN